MKCKLQNLEIFMAEIKASKLDIKAENGQKHIKT